MVSLDSNNTKPKTMSFFNKAPFILLGALMTFYACSKDDTDVIAVENTPNTTQEISIDLDDISIEVEENTSVNTLLSEIIVEVTGSTATPTYQLTDIIPDGAISIANNQIVVADATLFNYESYTEITARLTASINEQSSTAQINIDVLDIEDAVISVSNFQATIDENPVQGTLLGEISASSDQGAIDAYEIIDGQYATAFTINENGQLYVNDTSFYDYETNTSLSAIIRVTKGTSSETLNVNVNINNLNEGGGGNGNGEINENAFVLVFETTSSNQSIRIPANSDFVSAYDYQVDWGDGTTTTEYYSANHEYTSAGSYTVQITGDFPALKSSNSSQDSAYRDTLKSVENWGEIAWQSMDYMFYGVTSNLQFNASDQPNLSNVSSMDYTFAEAQKFNQDIRTWDVSNVQSMNSTFKNADDFNKPLNNWDVSAVVDMSLMFSGAETFNKSLDSWDVSNVYTMELMFDRAYSFNGVVSSWNVANVEKMAGMFNDATQFNQDISSWDVGSVTDMSVMFAYTSNFNQNISAWDVSSVRDMTAMFISSTTFDQDLSNWNTSSVTNCTAFYFGTSMSSSDTPDLGCFAN